MTTNRIAGSFRDPSGFLFRSDGKLLRQINHSYAQEYETFVGSGLYQILADKGLIIPHQEVDLSSALTPDAYKVIQPEELGFISYPYEWSFSQLKTAARMTLRLQKLAMRKGMTLKDASAYNIQFHQGRPVLIDSLSFERYKEGTPWVAYRQFCQHFLAPLALMALVDIRLGQLLRTNIDGIPLDLASQLLPWRTRLNAGLSLHLHLHARSQRRYAGKDVSNRAANLRMKPEALLMLIRGLARAIKGLTYKPEGTAWAEYTSMTHYSDQATEHKKQLVAEFLAVVKPKMVWDLGANVGVYSRVAAETADLVLAVDNDPAAVEMNARTMMQEKQDKILPLLIDLTNPSPSLGWASEERASLVDRAPADVVMALALIHHLAISNNVPLDNLAQFFARLSPTLILEFVPKRDSQTQMLLASRDDIFDDYTEEGFESAFGRYFNLIRKEAVKQTERTLYLMERKSGA
jgi:ribosomal protein L11 methylase PrmA